MSEFRAFPASKIQQIENRQKASAPYISPHLPPESKAAMQKHISGANMQASVAGHILNPVAPQVAVQAPGFTAPTSEPEAVALELPSQYAFYEFKDLYVKPFKGKHLAKLSRAKEEHSTLHIAEAVSSVLTNTNNDVNLGFRLTLPDFYFVLYWLRMNSFSKSVFTHSSTCSNPEHIKRITSGELNIDTLSMSEVIRKSMLKTIMLETIPNPELFVLDYPGVKLYPATMLDAIAMTEDPDFMQPEFQFSSQISCYIRGQQEMSLRARNLLVDEFSADDINTVKAYEDAVSEYGVVEQVKVTCKTCGTSKIDKIELDAHSFFQ